MSRRPRHPAAGHDRCRSARRRHGGPHPRRGLALVVVLWVVIVAGVMLLGVQNAVRMQLALGHGEVGAVEAHWLARAGVEQALAVLEDDHRDVDSPLEDWYQSPALFAHVPLGSGWFTVASAADQGRAGLEDECGKIDLNTADKRQLTEFKPLNDTQIDSLIDWRTAGDTPGDQGAKAGYYLHLPYPYELRGKPLQTHRELLLVRGFEDRQFFPEEPALAATGPAAQTTVYSYQANQDAQGTPRVNFNTATEQTLQERFHFTAGLAQAVVQGRSPQPYRNLAALLEVRPSATSGSGAGGGAGAAAASGAGQGSGDPPVTQITLEWLAGHVEELALQDGERLSSRVNLNTASAQVLRTLPGLTDALVDQVMAQRESGNGAFTSLADVLRRGVVPQDVLRGLLEKVTVHSDVFTAESVGVTATGMQRRILVVIDRGRRPAGILYWYQTP